MVEIVLREHGGVFLLLQELGYRVLPHTGKHGTWDAL